jgi:hypothetical protein
MHLVGREQQLLGCPGWLCVRLTPFYRETIEWLVQRARGFLKAKQAYPDLYETYEFESRLEWYDTGAGKDYDDQVDREKLERLTDDVAPHDDGRRSERDKLDGWEIPWILIPTDELPASGNLAAECEQLVMCLRDDTSDTVELRWVCYMKHTDVELRTFDISSEDIDRWLAKLEQRRPPCRTSNPQSVLTTKTRVCP